MYECTVQAALTCGDISEMKSARGVHGFVRYWGPQNGGINEQSQAAYSALLKLFLQSASLRWFVDTYLTGQNIALLLDKTPEFKQMKKQWYCIMLNGCVQDNSHFPLMLWIKKQQHWKEEEFEDGLFLTMKASMSEEVVIVNDGQDTPSGLRSSQRARTGIELHCTKTHGCDFVAKNARTMAAHEKSCQPKATTQLSCSARGCKFVTNHKHALTNHIKKCGTPAESDVGAPPPRFACPHQGCNETHATKKESAAHQRTHKKRSPTATPKAKKRAKVARKNESESESSEDSDDGEREEVTHKKKQGAAKKKSRKGKPAPATGSGLATVTKRFMCPYCGESHDTPEQAQSHQRKHVEPTSSLREGAPSWTGVQVPESHGFVERGRIHFQKHQNFQFSEFPESRDFAHLLHPQHQNVQPRQGGSCGMYKCSHCDKSHESADRARRHQEKHQPRQPPGEVQTICPECKVYSGTPALVLSHVGACRASLTCTVCHIKCDTHPLLVAHMLRCLHDQQAAAAAAAVDARKRPREDEESWQPTRSRNKREDVRKHWQRIHVKQWLKLVELEEYEPKFLEEQVDGRILLQLTEERIRGTAFGMKDTHAAKFLELRASFE